MKLTTYANRIKVRTTPNLDYYVMVAISLALIISAIFFFIPNFLKIIPNNDFSNIFLSQNIVTTVSFLLVTILGNVMPILVIVQYFNKFKTNIAIKDGILFCDEEEIATIGQIDDIQIVFHFEDDCYHLNFISDGEKTQLPIELTQEEANSLYAEVVQLTNFKRD